MGVEKVYVNADNFQELFHYCVFMHSQIVARWAKKYVGIHFMHKLRCIKGDFLNAIQQSLQISIIL